MNDNTSWRLTAIESFSGSLELRVDTRAPAVISAIEEAAELAGIVLQRIELDEQAEPEAEPEPELEESTPAAEPSPIASRVVTGQMDDRFGRG